jgi:hypothetical protein
MKTLLLLLISLIITVFPILGAEVDMASDIEKIVEAPDWTRPEADELINKKVGVERGKKILASLEKYRDLSPEKARQFVALLSSSGEKHDLNIAGKIYIFNRLYCNVPERVEKTGWKFFGGWGSVPDDGITVGALFPLKETNDGKLELHYVSGSYTGPSYEGIKEFDFLLQRFGKRK